MADKGRSKSRARSEFARSFMGLGDIRRVFPGDFSYKHYLILLGISLLLTALMIDYDFRPIPEYKVGDIADRAVEAPEEFTIIDESATQEKIDDVISRVPAIFTFDFTANHQVTSQIRMAFADARQVLDDSRLQLGLDEGAPIPVADLPEIRRRLEVLLPKFDHGDTLATLLKYGFPRDLEDRLVEMVAQAMKYPGVVWNREALLQHQDRGIILVHTVTKERETLNDWLDIRDVDQARNLIRQRGYELDSVTNNEREELLSFLEIWVVPNCEFDAEGTREAELKAEAEVAPVVIQVKKGRTIVRIGDEISENSLSQLNALKTTRRGKVQVKKIFGVFIMASILIVFLVLFFRLQRETGKDSYSKFILVTAVLAISLLVVRFFFGLADMLSFTFKNSAIQDPYLYYFYTPVAFGAALTVLLLGRRTGLFFSILNAVFIGILTGELSMGVYALMGSLCAVFALESFRERWAVVRAGLLVGLVNLLVSFAFSLLASDAVFSTNIFLIKGIGCLASGLVSTALASACLPALESIFGLTTDVRLLELSNLNSPIMRRLSLEAPGTYHHSITVGILAEAGAEAVRANGLLARVGAYYHDIGKLKQPDYYVENQIFSVNKHEDLTPAMSSLILASHVKNGLAFARELKLAPLVSGMIPQHHGTRLQTFFYQKAKEAAGEKGVDVEPDDFRYPGPKPQSKEAAILMLADQVEAAARTLQDPNPSQIRSLIHRLSQSTIQDGQFDECDVTLKEISKVEKAFERVLAGMHHQRIEYPGYDFNKRTNGKESSQPTEKSDDKPLQ